MLCMLVTPLLRLACFEMHLMCLHTHVQMLSYLHLAFLQRPCNNLNKIS